jgi:TetR/AcrR family transcriptional regulator
MSTLTDPEKKILDAAKKVFETYGFAGARMQNIADEAGISKASLHYYFRSKEKLFDHIFDETMTEFIPIISAWEENDTTNWEEKLKAFISTFFSFLKTKSLLFILREINRNPDLLSARKKDGKSKKIKFLNYFDKLKEEGKIKDVDMRMIYIAMHSLCAYPIINGVLFKMNLGLNDKQYDQFMEQYTLFITDFLIESIKNKKSK